MTTATDKQQVIRSNQMHTQARKCKHTHTHTREANNAARALSLIHKRLIHDSVRLEANPIRASRQRAPNWPDIGLANKLQEVALTYGPDECGYHFKRTRGGHTHRFHPVRRSLTLLRMDMLIWQTVMQLSYFVYVCEKVKGVISRISRKDWASGSVSSFSLGQRSAPFMNGVAGLLVNRSPVLCRSVRVSGRTRQYPQLLLESLEWTFLQRRALYSSLQGPQQSERGVHFRCNGLVKINFKKF